MNIKRAKQEITNTVKAYLEKDSLGEYRIPQVRQRPILLMGPPGIGKTQIMEQIAGECDLALVSYTITHHTRQSAIGLPYIVQKQYGGKEYSVTEYTMSEIIASVYDRMEASGKREGILFLDEINCVSETLSPAMLQFLQGKTFGNHRMPDGWIIVAAGNPPEFNRSVREFDVVTLDRVKVIPVEADYPVWKEYAYQAGIHGSILSYLEIRRDQFYRMETTVDGKRFVTARGWQDLSELLWAYERLGIRADREVTGQYLQHTAVAKDFANYLELYYRYQRDYQVDEILDGTIRPAILDRLKFAAFDERIEVTGLLLAKLAFHFRETYETDQNTDRLYALLKRYHTELGLDETDAASRGAAEYPDSAMAPERNETDSEIRIAGKESPLQILRSVRTGEEELLKNRILAGQNAKELKAQLKMLSDRVSEYEAVLQEKQLYDPQEAFRTVSGEFRKDVQHREGKMQQTAQTLEYAFDFMEAAFGESQEMVLFITELSVNLYAAAFLREYDCARYFRYNKSLLFEDHSAQIRKELDKIREMQRT